MYPNKNKGQNKKEDKKQNKKEGKEGYVVFDGEVTSALPNAMFKVSINNEEMICFISGKLRKNMINILPGDMVRVEVSTYDASKGRIIYRMGKKLK